MRKNRQAVKHPWRANTAKAQLRSIELSGPIVAADTLIVRIVKSLDISFERLAEICEISYPDLLELVSAGRSSVSKFDTDPMWNKLHQYVQTRLALLMAVRIDLDAKMQDDRKQRAAHRLRQETHE